MKRPKKPASEKSAEPEDKRPRTAFSGSQLARLKVIKNKNLIIVIAILTVLLFFYA